MNRVLLSLIIAGLASGAASAQTALTASQQEGQRLFVQHCGLCHLKLQINVPAPSGPVLSKAILENGKEAQVKAQIANGSPNMPGYKLMFDATEIDAIIDYLKTLNPAPATATPANR